MKTIIVDSDAIFALYNPNDPLNAKATATFSKLIDSDYELLYPTSVLFEVVSLFQRVLPTPTVTTQITEMVKEGLLPVVAVDAQLLKESAVLFNPAGSKKNTLIDCSVVAIAKKLNATAVFAYDEFYKKHGLSFAEEVL